jgi:hypothetical protein
MRIIILGFIFLFSYLETYSQNKKEQLLELINTNDSLIAVIQTVKYEKNHIELKLIEQENIINKQENIIKKLNINLDSTSLDLRKTKNQLKSIKDSLFWFSEAWYWREFHQYSFEGDSTESKIDDSTDWSFSLSIDENKIVCTIYCCSPFEEHHQGSWSLNDNSIDFFFNSIGGTISFNEIHENDNVEKCKKNNSMQFEKINESQIKVYNYGCECSEFANSSAGPWIILNKY